ncbi:MAG: hypothetical protein L0177_04005, partial [Chloroflexi bacterium]|nr:hypothetical protein [Chloroflexota bacterium]
LENGNSIAREQLLAASLADQSWHVLNNQRRLSFARAESYATLLHIVAANMALHRLKLSLQISRNLSKSSLVHLAPVKTLLSVFLTNVSPP